MTAEDRAALVAKVQAVLDCHQDGLPIETIEKPLLRTLLADHARLVQERDEARADAGELLSIQALVSDRDEVGCYAKVEGLEREHEAAESHLARLAPVIQEMQAASPDTSPRGDRVPPVMVRQWADALEAIHRGQPAEEPR